METYAKDMTVQEINDRRVRRTHLAVFDAFRTLVLSRRYSDVRVGDIIDMANIGRSTFYDHFKSKDDVLLNSIEPLFTVLADSAVNNAERSDVIFVLSHFWSQRKLARVVFGPDIFFKLTRKLADMIEIRMSSRTKPAQRMIATYLATSQLGVIRAWVGGEFSIEPENFADYIMAKGKEA